MSSISDKQFSSSPVSCQKWITCGLCLVLCVFFSPSIYQAVCLSGNLSICSVVNLYIAYLRDLQLCRGGTDPVLIDCRSADTKKPWNETEDKVFEVPCALETGIVCRNANQTDEMCDDYEVQYLCEGMCIII